MAQEPLQAMLSAGGGETTGGMASVLLVTTDVAKAGQGWGNGNWRGSHPCGVRPWKTLKVKSVYLPSNAKQLEDGVRSANGSFGRFANCTSTTSKVPSCANAKWKLTQQRNNRCNDDNAVVEGGAVSLRVSVSVGVQHLTAST